MLKVIHNISFVLCLICSIICILSCSDDLVENSSYNTDLSSGVTLIVSTDNQTASRASYDGLHAEFEEGDAIGVYVIDNGTLVASNIKFTLNGGVWTSNTKVKYSPDCTYMAYYPYNGSPYVVNNSDDADLFFSSFVTDNEDKFHYADQSTKKNFDASDLMISKGNTSAPKKIAFRMEHKKALARITGNSNVCMYGDGRSDRIPAILNFGGNLPYLYEGEYRYLMKPGTETVVGGMKLSGKSGHYTAEDINISNLAYIEYEVSNDGGNTWTEKAVPPSWLIMTTQREGKFIRFVATTSDERTTNIIKGSYQSKNDYLLKNAQEVIFHRDLSYYNNDGTYRGKRTTANCYLVHAPGTYSLPMVFGNAIVDGEKNPQSYNTTAVGENIMSNLVDYKNQPIEDSWVTHNVYVNDVKLVWQDSPGLIPHVGQNGNYIHFTINRETITEGNAVIAALDMHGEIVWSWHIWVTPETLSEVSTINTGSHEYKVAPVNVGWVSPKGTCNVYEGSQCKVKVRQNDGSTISFIVKQRDGFDETTTTLGFSPFYQWGRKDPFVSGNPSTNTSYVAYDEKGNVLPLEIESQDSDIGFTIRNPMVLTYNSTAKSKYGPYSTAHSNYWDMNQNNTGNISTATKKTIYDPCPPGHCVPTSNMFYYMGNGGLRSDRNYDTTNSLKIWTIDGANMAFNILGSRYFQASDTYVSGVYCWSATASDEESAVNLKGDSRYWRYNTLYRAYGCPIRSVLEE